MCYVVPLVIVAVVAFIVFKNKDKIKAKAKELKDKISS